MLFKLTGLVAAACLLSGCSATDSTKLIAKQQDPRVGESHKKVCDGFALKSWDDVSNDRRGIVIQTRDSRFFKLHVIGDCDPRTPRDLAAFENRTGNCLSVGDRVRTNTDYRGKGGQVCTIMKIYDWSPEALAMATDNDGVSK